MQSVIRGVVLVLSVAVFGGVFSGCLFGGGGDDGGAENTNNQNYWGNEDTYTAEDTQEPQQDVALIRSAEFFGDKIDGKFLTYVAHVLGQNVEGTPIHFVKNIQIENLTDVEQNLVLSAQLQGYSELASKIITLPPYGLEAFDIDVSFDFSKLYSVTSPVAAVAEIKLETKSGELQDALSRTLQVQSKNSVFWSMDDGNGGQFDLRHFVVTLVTPEDKDNEIEKLITEAGKLMPSGVMHGYGLYDEDVIAQATALYNAIKNRGIIYTSVGGSLLDGSQNVKLPAESLNTGSSNCIDGTLVFASAFEALGMNPLIILTPTHAFVGLRIGAYSDQALFIETTMLSSSSAEEAMQYGLQEFQDFDESSWLVVDVVALRGQGLIPMNL